MAASEVRALGNPFHRALNRLLDEHGFDEFAEAACREFYAEKRGRPGIPPGVYFRMPMVGYLEGIGSERGIAWRCADPISLREFLGYGLSKNPPEHSGLSKTRKRLSVEAHAAVFGRVVELLRSSGLPSGRTLGVDSTTLEANAAMRSIVRRDDGKGYEEWLEQVARASGIETPTREDLAKLDRTRPKKKTSNKDWVHPHDPEARIAKMKDGRTRMAHKQGGDPSSNPLRTACAYAVLPPAVLASMSAPFDRRMSTAVARRRRVATCRGVSARGPWRRSGSVPSASIRRNVASPSAQ